MRVTSSLRKRVAVVLVAVGLVVSSVSIAESIYAFVRPSEYHFGSEPMVGYGGWKYKTRGHYLAHGTLFGVIVLFGAASAAVFLVRRSHD